MEKIQGFPDLSQPPARGHAAYANHIWAADFTEFVQHGKKVYVATVIDLYTRRILGIQVTVRKGAALTIQALSNALLHHPRPDLFHSDNGREYDAMAFTEILDGCGIVISRSRPGCPWENGYQESFYDKFKVDLGDPNRFKTLGELVAEIYRTLWRLQQHADSLRAQHAACGIRQTVCVSRVKNSQNQCLKKSVLDTSIHENMPHKVVLFDHSPDGIPLRATVVDQS